jgi:phosphopantetheine adenylyltransferase
MIKFYTEEDVLLPNNFGIVSGYFASGLHDGHKKYISDAAEESDFLYIIIQSDRMLEIKYPDYKHLSAKQIKESIEDFMPELDAGIDYKIIINDKKTIAKQIKKIAEEVSAKSGADAVLTLYKDGDRDLKSLPKKEIIQLYENDVYFKFLGNKKVCSSKDYMSKKGED